MLSMSFGSRIKDLRKELNMSQSDFGKEIGVSGTTISQYESDLRFPDQTILVSICKLLNVSSDFLLGLSDVKSPPLQTGRMVITCELLSEEQLETLRILTRSFQTMNSKKGV